MTGVLSYEDMVDKIKMETRRYAKRQITWFKRYENATVLDMSKPMDEILGVMRCEM